MTCEEYSFSLFMNLNKKARNRMKIRLLVLDYYKAPALLYRLSHIYTVRHKQNTMMWIKTKSICSPQNETSLEYLNKPTIWKLY